MSELVIVLIAALLAVLATQVARHQTDILALSIVLLALAIFFLH